MARTETTEHRAAFETWCLCNRNFIQTAEKIGQKRANLYNWADRYGWYDRADTRDRAAAKIADTEAAKETAKFLKAQQQAGQLLRLKGVQFITGDNAITDGRTAIAAVKTGIDIERQSLGLPEWIAKILNADASTLQSEIADMERRRREALGDSEDTAGGTAGIAETPGPPPLLT